MVFLDFFHSACQVVQERMLRKNRNNRRRCHILRVSKDLEASRHEKEDTKPFVFLVYLPKVEKVEKVCQWVNEESFLF